MTSKEKFLALVSNMPILSCDAVIILEGDGKHRIEHGCSLYKRLSDNIVFSGNITDLGYGSYPLDCLLDEFGKQGVSRDEIIWENESTNTKEQAENVIELCLARGWVSIIIVASNYHQYRAYLTFLKSLEKRDLLESIAVYNSPSNLPWFVANPWGMRHELLETEFEKIDVYQGMGDVATYELALRYFRCTMI